MGQRPTEAMRPETAGHTVTAPDESGDSTQWTVMGYLAGDNNLNEEMVLTLQELLALSDPDPVWPRVKILAQLDPSGMGLPTQRYVFETPGKPASEKRYLKTYLEDPDSYIIDAENTGNPDALSGFVRWAVQESAHKAVADHYALILSGHGSGSTEDFLLKDDNPVDALSIDELELALCNARGALGKATPLRLADQEPVPTPALPEGISVEAGTPPNKRIDLLGMDCCFMSMFEVFYQIRDHVDIVVAAESMVPDFGWPYHRILATAENSRTAGGDGIVTPEELAKIMVREFIRFYSDYDRTAGRSVDLAAIRIVEKDLRVPFKEVNHMDELAISIRNLAAVLLTAIEDPALADGIHLSHWKAQTYKFDQFVDLWDFCTLLENRFKGVEQSIVDACGSVKNRLQACVILSGCSGFAYQHSYGMSIYFPWAVQEVSDEYRALAFNSDPIGGTPWADFLDRYLELTRRDPRLGPEMTDPTEEDSAQGGAINRSLLALANNWTLDQNRGVAIRHLQQTAGIQRVPGSGFTPGGSKYHMSRYHMSRYHMSRYHMSRWPGDREKSTKNFTPVIGTAFCPPWPEADEL